MREQMNRESEKLRSTLVPIWDRPNCQFPHASSLQFSVSLLAGSLATIEPAKAIHV